MRCAVFLVRREGRHSCFVLIDLKLGKLTHQDLGQMQMCVNYFDRHQREEHEAPTVGIVLCSDKNDAMVKITLPEDNHQVHASRYQLYLPTEEEIIPVTCCSRSSSPCWVASSYPVSRRGTTTS